MARGRKKTTPRRNRFRGVNLLSAAEGLIQANIVTQNLFNTDPVAFLIGKYTGGYGNVNLAVSNTDGVKIGVGELLGLGGANGPANRNAAMIYLKRNWMKMTMQTVGTTVGFKVGKKLLSKPRSQINRGLKQIGMGQLVRV